jgi:hypothetical protein
MTEPEVTSLEEPEASDPAVEWKMYLPKKMGNFIAI